MESTFSPVWLITGCSSGLGHALALAALRAGHRVVATARDIRFLSELESFPRAHLLTLDVTDSAQIKEVVASAVSHFGRIDLLVNNAGVGLLGAVEEVSADQVDACMNVNFRGPLELMRAVAPHFREQKSGKVIAMSAAAVVGGYAGFSAYAAAKAALEAATEAFGLEMAPYGVQVMIVQPGPFRTEFIQKADTAAGHATAAYAATVGRFGKILQAMSGKQPNDPAKAASLLVELASDPHQPWPLRLPLGKYMLKKSRDNLTARIGALDAWEGRAGAMEW